eukprot:NODE_16610_length_985_cov_13.052448.p1 GENE.NODE_16610_length_985_cov_13.052448~~NODE_16610_length_985_cov_13.052448.p1  ORF type:complete len:229 (-),score=86.01 NODE_16610_length_985_cov_13.052448:298-909(-)
MGRGDLLKRARELDVVSAPEDTTWELGVPVAASSAAAAVAELTVPATDKPGAAPSEEGSEEGDEAAKLRLLNEIDSEPNIARHFSELARVVGEEERVLVRGHMMGRKELYIRAIELDPTDAVPFSNLGAVISYTDGDTAAINGVEHTECDLYIKALELNPRLSLGYLNLGDVLQPGEKVELHGVWMDQEQLYERSSQMREEEE